MKLRFESNRNITVINVKIDSIISNEPHMDIDININGEWCCNVIQVVKSNSGAYYTRHIRRIYKDGDDKIISATFRLSNSKVEFKSIKLKNTIQKNIINNY
jgi:hypothetical protein